MHDLSIDRLWSIVLAGGVERSASLLLACALLAASCAKSAVHGAVSLDALPP